jgi:hypothetical protein
MALTACIHSPVGLLDQTQPIPAGASLGSQPVSGQSCEYRFLGVFGFGGNSIEEARNAALAEANAVALVNVSIESNSVFWVLGTTVCVRVKGIPVAASESGLVPAHPPAVGVAPPAASAIPGSVPAPDARAGRAPTKGTCGWPTGTTLTHAKTVRDCTGPSPAGPRAIKSGQVLELLTSRSAAAGSIWVQDADGQKAELPCDCLRPL